MPGVLLLVPCSALLLLATLVSAGIEPAAAVLMAWLGANVIGILVCLLHYTQELLPERDLRPALRSMPGDRG